MEIKIFLISNMYPSKKNPAYGIFVKNFEKLLISDGFEFPYKAVITGRGSNWINKIMKYFTFFINIFTFIHKSNYNLIYVHYIGHSLIPLLFVQRFINKPLVINAHGSDVFPTSGIGKLIQKLVTSVIKKADLIVVPSEYFQNVITEKFQIEKKRIFVSPSAGIDTNLFKPAAGTRSSELFTIGYVSRIDKGKGWDILLNAIKILKEKDFSRFEVLMIGGGSQEKELSNMIQRYQLQDWVKIIGLVPHNELVQWYQKMDVFVFPTQLTESLGLVGLEAMACGVPVIGSDIGGLRGYVKNGINGRLFMPGDAKELALALEKFMQLTNSEKRAYSSQAFETASCYESKQVISHLKEKLSNLVMACQKKRRYRL